MSILRCVCYICGFEKSPIDEDIPSRPAGSKSRSASATVRLPRSQTLFSPKELAESAYGDLAWHPNTFSALSHSSTNYAYISIPPRAAPPNAENLPTLLFLHSIPLSSVAFSHQIIHFASLGYGILAPDLLGHGLSGKPLITESYGMRKMCDEVIGVMRKARVRKAVAVAHGSGALMLAELLRGWHIWFEAVVILADGSMNAVDKQLSASGVVPYMLDSGAELPSDTFDDLLALIASKDPAQATKPETEGHETAKDAQGLPSWMNGHVHTYTQRAPLNRGLIGTRNWWIQLRELAAETAARQADGEIVSVATKKVLLITGRGSASEQNRVELKRVLEPWIDSETVEQVEVDARQWIMLENQQAVNSAIERFTHRLRPPRGEIEQAEPKQG